MNLFRRAPVLNEQVEAGSGSERGEGAQTRNRGREKTVNAIGPVDVRQMVQDLSEQHHLAQELLDAIPVPVFYKDVNRAYLGCNRAFEAYVGRPRSELVGKTVYDLWPPDLARLHDEADLNALSMPGPQIHESSVLGADGILRTVEFHKAKFTHLDGSVGGLVGVIFDITDRKVAGAALRQNEELYRRIVQDQTDMICRTLPDGTITFVNDAYSRFFGRTPEDLIGTSIYSLMPEEVRIELAEAVAGLTPLEPTVTLELPFAFSDGRSGWTQWTQRAFFDETERLAETQATGSDTTGRKMAEQELVRLRRQSETILASVADGIFVVDMQGNHTFVNPAAAAILGYTPEELIGRRSHSTWHHTKWDGSPYPAEECPICAARMDGQVHRGGNEPFWRRDGTRFPAEFVSAPIIEEGEVVGIVVTFRDITSRRLAEEAQQMAMIGQMAAGVAHDLGSLLTGIKTWARLAKEGGATQDQMVAGVLEAAAEGSAIAKNLMGFARPHRQAIVEPVGIETVIDSAFSVADQRLKAGKVKIVRQYAAAGAPVATDRTQMGRVFLNLIVNAGQAMPEGGTLTVATSYTSSGSEGGEVVVTVADTGKGIAPEHLPHIFEPFFTTKTEASGGEAPGTGLGLSVARDIVTAHGGSMTMQSQVGQGTTFEVRLPTVSIDKYGAVVR